MQNTVAFVIVGILALIIIGLSTDYFQPTEITTTIGPSTTTIQQITTTTPPITTTISTTTIIINLISEQEALDLANAHIQSECPNINYGSINRTSWDKNAERTLYLLHYEHCPGLEKYNYLEMWETEKYINETECSLPYPEDEYCKKMITLVGIDGKFKCSYVFSRYGTPSIASYRLSRYC